MFIKEVAIFGGPAFI